MTKHTPLPWEVDYDKLNKLVEALQAVEWEDVGGSLFVGKRCPFCEAYYENEDAGYATPQHKEDCIRQKALDKGSG